MTDGNGRVFKWIAGSLFTICILISGAYVNGISQKIDTVKTDSAYERLRVEARVDANTADLVEIKGDLKLIKHQVNEILNILKNRKDSL